MSKPDAYAWAKDKLKPFVDLGVKGWKIDRGDMGENPTARQNENVMLYDRMAFEALAASNGPDQLIVSRDTFDTGRKYTSVWSGDTQSTFTGVAYSLAEGLRSGAIVMPNWGSDIGGYLGQPSEEVYARWLELGAFSPIMEAMVGGGQTPWYNYSPALVEIARKHAALHHDLMPYARSVLFAATTTGAPLMRALVFAYPDDPKLANLWDEYLFGSELLVAPVITGGATGRSVYLPAGRWLDYNGRASIVGGGQTTMAAAPRDTIPVFVREGAIVPRGDVHRGNNNWTPDWKPSLRIEVFPSFRVRSHFDYYTGAAVVGIDAGGSGRDLTIQLGDLALPGQLDVYVNAFASLKLDGAPLAAADYSFDTSTHLLTVPWKGGKGTTTLVIEGATSIYGDMNNTDPPIDAGMAPAVDAGEAVSGSGGADGAGGAPVTPADAGSASGGSGGHGARASDAGAEPPPAAAVAEGGCSCTTMREGHAGWAACAGCGLVLALALARARRHRRP